MDHLQQSWSDPKVQRFKGSKVQRFKGSKVQGFKKSTSPFKYNISPRSTRRNTKILKRPFISWKWEPGLVVLVLVRPMRMGMDVLMDMNFFVKVNRAIFHGINGIRDVG